MSDAAVMTRPSETEEAQWIEMDEATACVEQVISPIDFEAGFIELDDSPVETFGSQDAMRFGPRAYTPEQANVIRLAMSERRPLKVAPLPLNE
jgi:hypothetical protein